MTAIVECQSGWITKTKTKSQFGKQQNQIFLLNQIGYPWATLAPGGWLAIHGKSRSMTCLSMNEIRSPMGYSIKSKWKSNQIKVQEIGRRWLDEVEAVCTLQLNPPDLSVAKGSFLCILEKNPCRSSEQKSQSQGSSTNRENFEKSIFSRMFKINSGLVLTFSKKNLNSSCWYSSK